MLAPGSEPFLVPRHHLLRLFAEAASDTQPCVASNESRESWRVTHAIGMHPMLVNENACHLCPARSAACRRMHGVDTITATLPRFAPSSPGVHLPRQALGSAFRQSSVPGLRHGRAGIGAFTSGLCRTRMSPFLRRRAAAGCPVPPPCRDGTGIRPVPPVARHPRASDATGLASRPSADTMTRSTVRQPR